MALSQDARASQDSVTLLSKSLSQAPEQAALQCGTVWPRRSRRTGAAAFCAASWRCLRPLKPVPIGAGAISEEDLRNHDIVKELLLRLRKLIASEKATLDHMWIEAADMELEVASKTSSLQQLHQTIRTQTAVLMPAQAVTARKLWQLQLGLWHLGLKTLSDSASAQVQ